MRTAVTIVITAALSSSALAAPGAEEWSIARVWDEEMLYAIRLSTPRPPVHARNLYHVSAAMYDAWAAWDPTARGVFVLEKHTSKDPDAARHEAISYAAYRVLKNRFVAGNGPNIAAIQAHFDALFASLGYDAGITTTVGDSPAAIGNRIAATIIALGMADGSNQSGNYAPNNGYAPVNAAMPFKIPGTVMLQPNRWQPLAFDFLILQNGEVVGASVQSAIGPHWGGVVPFAMLGIDRAPGTQLYFDQGGPPLLGSTALKNDAVDLISRSSILDPTDPATIDISPAVFQNCPIDGYSMPGYGLNPVTGQPYPSNVVKLADYARTSAEYWADGPTSETPPGHWHVIANEVSDLPGFHFMMEGVGSPLDRLEWDVKIYLAIGGANHDAAVTAWGMKGYYDSVRPISFIRYMAQLGQSSNPGGPMYNPAGFPLQAGLIEQVVAADLLPGGRFDDFVELVYNPLTGDPVGTTNPVGAIAVQTWLGGLIGGVTGVSTEGPLPGHVHKNGSGWHIGGFAAGTDDSPGVLNPGLSTASLQISEIRINHTGNATEQFVELTGPPGMPLDGLTYIVIGDETLSKVPDPQGRVQNVVSLAGKTMGPNGTFVIARTGFTMSAYGKALDRPFRRFANCTHMLVGGFSGYLGQDLDFFDDGKLELMPWVGVLDSVSLRRSTGDGGIYSTTVVGPDLAKNQLYGVGWDMATRWMPYQSSNFVTPPFPGYTSGHSTYSRAAAEVLAKLTGSPYFPGGLYEFTVPAGWSNFETSPSVPITLQWVRYTDAATEAGISRLYGGIHPRADDVPGRVSGAKVGLRSAGRALALFEGLANSPDINFDGVVNGADLGLLIGNWGNAGAGDFNGDGAVNGADLGILIGNWG